MHRGCGVAVLFLLVGSLGADGPKDNIPDKVRRIPPPGIAVPPAERTRLEKGLQELQQDLAALEKLPRARDLIPDVRIFFDAVRYALQHDEFHKPGEFALAHKLLAQGRERAGHLRAGQAPWTTATGLVVRGYRSRIDGSVQPYGLVVPATYRPDAPHRHRLDLWFHGRGETLSELSFLGGRLQSPGQFTPKDAFVLHPYGRYCNANRFAGEMDTFEALEHARSQYPIDPDRIAVRGFSMGGAACWQFAVHHPGLWAAAAPGAGFSESPEFLRVFQKETIRPTWYEKKLLHLYDCTDYAVNLFHCPTVAYSGEIDRQKQAADIMAKYLAEEGIEMVHVIGPKTGHSYHPAARQEIDRRIDAILEKGRDRVPQRLRFTTWTLRYPSVAWLKLQGLETHWERARVEAELHPGRNQVQAKTRNVTALTFTFDPGHCPLDVTRRPTVLLDDQKVVPAPVLSDRSWVAHFRKVQDRWQAVADLESDGTLRKRPGLQGPIDDAFLDSFLMVRPTGLAAHPKTAAWTKHEMAHALEHWRRQFRGEARSKDDTAVNDADIAAHNLVLWGDPQSNRVLARILDKLPLAWSKDKLKVADGSFASDHHLPLLIYPNPLNPKKYVVLNSGFTFREYDYLNNARQVAKLPDFAVLDVDVPPTSRAPGGVVAAGFFDEHWRLPAKLRPVGP